MVSHPKSCYELFSELTGTKGPVNALLFSEDGTFLISGSDDQKVRVWNTDDLKCETTLHSDKWGQVTVLGWIHVDAPIDDKRTILFVGGGRGMISFRAVAGVSSTREEFIPKNFPIFNFNDAVEAQAYDRIHSRLAVSSHSGLVKMFTVERTFMLAPLWKINMGNTIPRCLMFYGVTRELLTFGLESGEICCREAQTSEVVWAKITDGAIGSASISADETTLIVNNLCTTNFDVLELPSSSPTKSLSFTSSRVYAKQCVFSDGARVAICGSTMDKAYVVDVATTECLQTLTMGIGEIKFACQWDTSQLNMAPTEADMMQTVAATGSKSRESLVAVGSSIGGIYLWKQKSEELANSTPISPLKKTQSFSEIARAPVQLVDARLLLLVVALTYGSWGSYFSRFCSALVVMVSSALNEAGSGGL